MNFGTRLRELPGVALLVPLVIILSHPLSFAQSHANLSGPASMGSSLSTIQLDPAKRIGRHTVAEWRSLIDSTWGEGLPTADKLKIFDDFWTAVDQRWGGFPNLTVNWDSLKDVYRPEVAAGVSRGRFDAILCRLSRALNEGHTWSYDEGIDGSMGYYFSKGGEYPNYQSFHYVQGLPVMMINALTFRTNFGAGLTPLPDSTALVYSVMPNHPLGLQPGDIILGYDGIPWMTLFNELLDLELPALGGGSWLSSTPEASLYSAIISAGMNWGLFDTIDVKKYPTNEIMHYPTSLLDSIRSPYFIATQQMPVSGVPFPDIQNGKMVSWGVVTGTNTGYIYVWDWGGPVGNQTDKLFSQAVDELLHVQKIGGLIIDSRTNFGGAPKNADGGFSQLFNFDPLSNYSIARRIAGDNHFAFAIEPYHSTLMAAFTATREIFDHPIAMLTNNTSTSGGDYNAHRMRFHPMVRFFGRPTAGSYTAFVDNSDMDAGTWQSSYKYNIHHSSAYSKYNDEGFLIHNPFPVDEDVWLTREGVANGEDDVVKSALQWITTLTHAHDVKLDKRFVPPGQDSVLLTAVVANPLDHAVSISAIITGPGGTVHDSLSLYDDGLHGDGSPGDSVWGRYINVPSDVNTLVISIRTDDVTEGTFRRLPNVESITTAGPVTVDSVKSVPHPGYVDLKPYVTNHSESATISGATVKIYCYDPWVTTNSTNENPLPTMAPGAHVSCARPSTLTYDESLAPDSLHFNLQYEILKNGWPYWIKTRVSGRSPVPTAYRLEQNYPNPFNPTTSIRFRVRSSGLVILKVYDVLGREVKTLVNEKRSPGTYEVKFDGSGLSSGVYFYRIKAGAYTSVKKMLMLK